MASILSYATSNVAKMRVVGISLQITMTKSYAGGVGAGAPHKLQWKSKKRTLYCTNLKPIVWKNEIKNILKNILRRGAHTIPKQNQ